MEYRVSFYPTSPFGMITPRNATDVAQVDTPAGMRVRVLAAAEKNHMVSQCVAYGRLHNLNALDLLTVIAFHALCQREMMYEEHLRLVASIPLPRFAP